MPVRHTGGGGASLFGRGLNQLIVDLDDAADQINERVAVAMEDSGPTFVRTARRFTPVDTGSLQRRVYFKVFRRKNPIFRLGPMNSSPDRRPGDKNAIKYAGYVHDGTARMAARPFVTRSIEAHTTQQGQFYRRLRRAGVAGLGKSTGGV